MKDDTPSVLFTWLLAATFVTVALLIGRYA